MKLNLHMNKYKANETISKWPFPNIKILSIIEQIDNFQ